MICPALLADDINKTDSVDARLRAIEQQLDRIEQLLRGSVPIAAQPDNGPGRIQVTILGQVNTPGVYIVDPDTPIGSLIGLAHGYTHIADRKHISVSPRQGPTVKVNASADPRAYKLRSGDIVTVPENPF